MLFRGLFFIVVFPYHWGGFVFRASVGQAALVVFVTFLYLFVGIRWLYGSFALCRGMSLRSFFWGWHERCLCCLHRSFGIFLGCLLRFLSAFAPGLLLFGGLLQCFTTFCSAFSLGGGIYGP